MNYTVNALLKIRCSGTESAISRVWETDTIAYFWSVGLNRYHECLNGTFLPGASRDTFGHAVDENTVRFTRKLADSIIDENSRRIASHQQPLPPAHQIVPWIVSPWNHVKGGQDVVSRILKNVKVDFRGLSPRAFVLIRAIMVSLPNAHIFDSLS